ncbi:hypothetical protein AB0M35_08035 [Micromonospora sp. NPDC051196]|uniref:hypothetical protein n=1 Tax=Micromonospora sp. NPDC051196 TaxID=3155281 RepID=UPI00342572E9
MIRSKKAISAILALTMIGLSACGPSDKAGSADPYKVLVDLYSGKESPEVSLNTQVADDLYSQVNGRTGEFVETDEPEPTLGFRGFLVTPADDALPTLRITQTDVYTIDGADRRRLADPGGHYYKLVLDDISGDLPQEVLNALP